MINENMNFIRANTIQDAWREVMWLCVKNGWDFLVKGGSYVGQIRKQLEWVTIVIDSPGERPLAPMLAAKAAPTSDDKIETYFMNYIFAYGQHSYYGKTWIQKVRIWFGRRLADLQGNGYEQYTYGDFVMEQIEHIIKLLNSSQGNTNQARIAIGDIETTHLSDPPCLNSIKFKVVVGKLNMTVDFRSWDLYAGLPENLGGLQLLKEYILTRLTFPCEDGKLIAFSDGLHIYDQYFSAVDSLNIDKIKVGEKAIQDKQTFILEKGI